MTGLGMDDVLLILLLATIVLSAAIQLVASSRWSPRASGAVAIGAGIAIGLVTLVEVAAHADLSGGATIGGLLAAAALAAGCWAVFAVAAHFTITFLRDRLRR